MRLFVLQQVLACPQSVVLRPIFITNHPSKWKVINMDYAATVQAGRALTCALAKAPAVQVTRGMEVRPRKHLLCAARNAATTLLLSELSCPCGMARSPQQHASC